MTTRDRVSLIVLAVLLVVLFVLVADVRVGGALSALLPLAALFSIAVWVFVLWLALRFVRAVERIAEKMGG